MVRYNWVRLYFTRWSRTEDRMTVEKVADDAGDVTVVDRGYVGRIHILRLDLELVVRWVAVSALKFQKVSISNSKIHVNCIEKLDCCKNREIFSLLAKLTSFYDMNTWFTSFAPPDILTGFNCDRSLSVSRSTGPPAFCAASLSRR